MCPVKNSFVLDMLHLGMSYSAVVCEFTINELTIYIQYHVFK